MKQQKLFGQPNISSIFSFNTRHGNSSDRNEINDLPALVLTVLIKISGIIEVISEQLQPKCRTVTEVKTLAFSDKRIARETSQSPTLLCISCTHVNCHVINGNFFEDLCNNVYYRL